VERVETDQIGRRLRQLREKAGKTQLELAYESGIGLRTVSRYEQGDPGMKVAALDALARTLGLRVGDLLRQPPTSRGNVRQPYPSLPAAVLAAAA
jgi:transcriptional regulator with XRE-family HTH domain